VRRAWAKRGASIRQAGAFSHLIAAIKQRSPARFLRQGLATPSAFLLFRQPIIARLARLLPRGKNGHQPRLSPEDVVFISRQRLTGADHDSAAHILGLAHAVRDAGLTPHLVQPSPSVFGHRPIQRLAPEMAVFETRAARRALTLGPWQICLEPVVWLRALQGGAARITDPSGLAHSPWTIADRLFVAKHARRPGDGPIIVLDSLFDTEALPYLMNPQARSAVIMQHRFSARADQFPSGLNGSVAIPNKDAEIAALGRVDAVIAMESDKDVALRQFSAWLRQDQGEVGRSSDHALT